MKRPRGRPGKLTPEIAANIIQYIKSGSSLKHAAEHTGLSERTLHNWLERGRAAEDANTPGKDVHFLHFFRSVAVSRAQVAVKIAATIISATQKDWRAGAWWLERTFPNEWGRKRLELTGNDDRPIRMADGSVVVNLDADHFDPNDLDRFYAQLLRPETP